MGIKDLYNPNKIQEIMLRNNGDIFITGENQSFQEYPKSIELWEETEDGKLLRIRRWLKKSIMLACYSTYIRSFEDIKPYIIPKL